MNASDAGLALIQDFEGLRLTTYRDSVGVLTIGWGHTGPDVVQGMAIDRAEAERLLRDDLHDAERAIQRLVTVPLKQHQFDALVSFTFNLGSGNLQGSTLLRKLNAKDYTGAGSEFSRWNKAGGRVLSGLIRRRAAERALFIG
ncbi:lysozyme [Pseudomonas cavernicola]|uniref:Lysozyme n=1 Tax=Pseudomonas cavernicola TaxID=2320866 RepID=A0A418XEL1_9PSED|nr:lysozyme [Pseudomonas cavernicola]RJG10929.1 lysozyme [Pseudomonas cavernicola]